MNYNKPLKHCPFCGAVAKRTGGTVHNITVATCRCSNTDCIASFKSVDHDVWNKRADQDIADATTTSQWQEYSHEEQ